MGTIAYVRQAYNSATTNFDVNNDGDDYFVYSGGGGSIRAPLIKGDFTHCASCYITILNGNWNKPGHLARGKGSTLSDAVFVHHKLTVTQDTVYYGLEVSPLGGVAIV